MLMCNELHFYLSVIENGMASAIAVRLNGTAHWNPWLIQFYQ